MTGSTIPAVLAAAARAHPELPALVDDDRSLTYAELHDEALALAASLVDAGVEQGERVALWGANSIEWAVAALGALCAGAVVVPVNARYTVTEAADIIGRAACVVTFADRGGVAGARDLASEAAAALGDRTVLALDDLPRGASPAARAEIETRIAHLSADDISHIQFTSGTTGRPKGAMLRHGAMVRTTADWVRTVGLRAGDRYPVVAPFSHIGGHKTGLLACLTAGAAARPFATLDLDRLAAVVHEWRATILQGPPTMFQSLIAHVGHGDGPMPSIRIAVTGAATVPPQLVRDLRDVLGVASVFTSYGLTEATGVCTITQPDDPPEVVASTSGVAIPGVEVQIFDDLGRPVAPGEHGEIVVRGHNLMAGYLDDAAATAEVVRDGWLHTGDVGWIGDDGNLRIVDRIKDLIIVGGFNVYPAEIERVLVEHPSVREAAVIGVADERMGEVPLAYVVTTAGAAGVPDDLVAFCQARLAKFKVPRTVVELDALPLNSAGKVSKVALRSSHQRGER
jgi:acyl-CoA synthetase (AMP-forming)/AMP-acid ligase II